MSNVNITVYIEAKARPDLDRLIRALIAAAREQLTRETRKPAEVSS